MRRITPAIIIALGTLCMGSCSSLQRWHTVISGVPLLQEVIVRIAGLEVEVSQIMFFSGVRDPFVNITVRNTTADTACLDMRHTRMIFMRDTSYLRKYHDPDSLALKPDTVALDLPPNGSGSRPVTKEISRPRMKNTARSFRAPRNASLPSPAICLIHHIWQRSTI